MYVTVIASNFVRILPVNSNNNTIANQSPYFNNEIECKKTGAVHIVKITKYMLRES